MSLFRKKKVSPINGLIKPSDLHISSFEGMDALFLSTKGAFALFYFEDRGVFYGDQYEINWTKADPSTFVKASFCNPTLSNIAKVKKASSSLGIDLIPIFLFLNADVVHLDSPYVYSLSSFKSSFSFGKFPSISQEKIDEIKAKLVGHEKK